MRLAELRPSTRVVLQSFLRDSVQLSACELLGTEGSSLVLRPLDELPTGIEGQPITLLASAPDCLLRVSGQVTDWTGARVTVLVDTDIEEVQRRRFARITGWLAVSLSQGSETGPGTLVDASAGGAAVLTNLDIDGGSVTMTVDGRAAHAEVVGLTKLDSGIRRLHLRYVDDHATTTAANAVMAMLES